MSARMSFCVLVRDDLTNFCRPIWLSHDATFDGLKKEWEWHVWGCSYGRADVCCWVQGVRVDYWQPVLATMLRFKCRVVHVCHNRGLNRQSWVGYSKL